MDSEISLSSGLSLSSTSTLNSQACSHGAKRAAWRLKPADESLVENIAQECGFPRMVARILVSRGITTPEEARAFISPNIETDMCDPAIIPGLIEAVDAIEAAIRANKRITVFGDFDLDGISATTILVRGFKELGCIATPFIPNRLNEGYGLSEAALPRLLKQQPEFVVTVDCGISNGLEVETLKGMGIDVVITDHHEPSTLVPKGVPVANPKLDPNCESFGLAGAGVALKVICVLGKRFDKPDLWLSLVDMATLGTVADLMPLTGENRALVAYGIKQMNTNPRPCILALASVAGADSNSFTSDNISFSLIPRLNAAGRMGSPFAALDLLLSDDPEEAKDFATALESLNTQRREIEAELTELAVAQAAETYDGERCVVVAGENWHEGVKGIVAARVAGIYHVPSIIFTVIDGVARGSGRTVGDINLFKALESCSDLLTKFGGHEAAVGVTLPAENLSAFRKRLHEVLSLEPKEAFASTPEVDAVVSLDEISLSSIDALDILRPFGQANKVPLFVAESVFLENRQAVGKNGEHFRFNATDGLVSIAGIMFRCENIAELLESDAAVDIVFEMTIDEWHGRRTAKLMVRKIVPLSATEEGPADDLVDSLFQHADESCFRGEYSGVAQMPAFNTKVVGVTFECRQELLKTLKPDTPLCVKRQPSNRFDSNAIAITTEEGKKLGFLNRALAAVLAPYMDGFRSADSPAAKKSAPYGYRAVLTEITGGGEGKSYGANIRVIRTDLDERELQNDLLDEDYAAQAEQTRRELEQLDEGALEQRLLDYFLPGGSLHAAQKHTLNYLAKRKSVLTVMATGRGKSLIFHIHAAKIALTQRKASVFIYPLRALITDQMLHIREAFSQVGLISAVLYGETPEAERREIFESIADGTVDVILSTPEFFAIHIDKFARTKRVDFVVVDEAHHLGMSRTGNRPAYAEFGSALEKLGNPPVLAVTATANAKTAQVIDEILNIDEHVLDPTIRANLSIDNHRNMPNRDGYLAKLVASGEKTIVYVNSRESSVRLARMLRQRVRELSNRIAFYNGGLSRTNRLQVEEAFRNGDLSCIVATSAFGEGVNIPDVKNVVLYHMPLNDVDFNQMSGRAGRNGMDATITLLFGASDARINERILSNVAPCRDDMATLYRALRDAQRAAEEEAVEYETGTVDFNMTNEDIAARAAKLNNSFNMDARGVSCGISVFRELDLVRTEGRASYRRIYVPRTENKKNLEDSIRYKEGLEEQASFKSFKQWVLDASAEELLEHFNRPILPE